MGRDVQSLLDSHRKAMFDRALRITRDRDAAEDLVQDASVRAFRFFDKFDGTNFEAWMTTILTNLGKNWSNKTKKSREVCDNDQALSDAIGDGSASALDLLIGDEIHPTIRLAMDEVRPSFARVVMMVDVLQWPYAKVAEEEGIPVGTVRSRLSRGRRDLRGLLEGFAVREEYLSAGEIAALRFVEEK